MLRLISSLEHALTKTVSSNSGRMEYRIVYVLLKFLAPLTISKACHLIEHTFQSPFKLYGFYHTAISTSMLRSAAKNQGIMDLPQTSKLNK